MSSSNFSSLPTELRLSIWKAALPEENDPPAIYIYGTEPPSPVYPLRSTTSHHDAENKSEESSSSQDYQSPPLQAFIPVSLPVPLLTICLESRTTVLDWARERNYLLYSPRARHLQAIIRRFDPLEDFLYIPISETAKFGNKPWHLPCLGPWVNNMTTRNVRIDHVAIPAAFLRGNHDIVSNLLASNPLPVSINIVFDLPPEMKEREEMATSDGEVRHVIHPRWELQHIAKVQRGIRDFWWEDVHGGFYTWDEDTFLSHEDIKGWVDEAKLAFYGFAAMNGQNPHVPFELESIGVLDDWLDMNIEPVVAVRT